MFTKFFKRFKKHGSKSGIQTDSVPDFPRELGAAGALPVTIPVVQVDPNTQNRHHSDIPASRTSPFSSPFYKSDAPATIQLSISNSHGFQIGEVYNVTVSNGGIANFHSLPSGLSSVTKSVSNLQSTLANKSCDNNQLSDLQSITFNYRVRICSFDKQKSKGILCIYLSRCLESGLHLFQKIEDCHINVISDNAGQDWRTLGQALNLCDTEIVAIDYRVKGDCNLAVKDILQTYVRRYPDTSVGFIASVLLDIGYIRAVEQLVVMCAESNN